ncbi:MAG: hypothetical protein WBP59_14990 [Ilumatobacteraceae bacterium]
MSSSPRRDLPAANLNDRARKAFGGEVGSATIEAIVLFNHVSGAGSVNDGAAHGGRSILGHPYAVERAIDLDDPLLRADLLQCWCALTPTEMVFGKPNPWSVFPKPGRLIERIGRPGTTLRWAPVSGLNAITRMIHLEFPDGRHLLTATLVRGRLRRKDFTDEPNLFVEAFGPAATEVDLA